MNCPDHYQYFHLLLVKYVRYWYMKIIQHDLKLMFSISSIGVSFFQINTDLSVYIYIYIYIYLSRNRRVFQERQLLRVVTMSRLHVTSDILIGKSKLRIKKLLDYHEQYNTTMCYSKMFFVFFAHLFEQNTSFSIPLNKGSKK